MNSLAMLRLYPIGDPHEKDRRQNMSYQLTDVKIHDLVLPRIHLPALKEGPLLASANVLNLMIPVLLGTKNEENCRMFSRQKKPKIVSARKKGFPSKYFPVGLNQCESHHWINAFMQFLLYIPLLRDFFSYTPYSMLPFNEFIDQYFQDVEEKKFVSQADSSDLIHCLKGKFPKLFQGTGVANLLEMIREISLSACVMTSLGDAGFRPEWQILWDPNQELSMQEIFDRPASPPELLVGLLPLYDPILRKLPQVFLGRSLLKQYFSTSSFICYELDAFIEHRAESGEVACYFTYLKVDGIWVQCADERITPMRSSTALDLPLRRGILFHYRRVHLR